MSTTAKVSRFCSILLWIQHPKVNWLLNLLQFLPHPIGAVHSSYCLYSYRNEIELLDKVSTISSESYIHQLCHLLQPCFQYPWTVQQQLLQSKSVFLLRYISSKLPLQRKLCICLRLPLHKRIIYI